MGVSGFYQETPSSPKLTKHRHPASFFFTSRARTPTTRVVVVPSPFHHAPFSALSPPSSESPLPYSVSFLPSPWASRAWSCPAARRGDAATPIGLLPGTPQPEGGWPGSRSSAGPAAPRRRRGRAHPLALPPAPSFSTSVAPGAQSLSLPRAVALPRAPPSSSLVAAPSFTHLCVMSDT